MGYGMKIENVVVSAFFGVPINLKTIVSKHKGVEYEPDQFPGLVFRLDQPKVASLIFSSGKIVCTGAKSPKDSKIAVGKIVGKLRKMGIKMLLHVTKLVQLFLLL